MNRTMRSLPGSQPAGPHVRMAFLAPVIAMVGTLALASCSTEYDPDEARGDQTILIKMGAADPDKVQSFSPNPVSVVVQTEVAWFNEDTEAHQIVSLGGIFGATVPTPPGEAYRHIFNSAGTYRYYCILPGHREVGVINVLP